MVIMIYIVCESLQTVQPALFLNYNKCGLSVDKDHCGREKVLLWKNSRRPRNVTFRSAARPSQPARRARKGNISITRNNTQAQLANLWSRDAGEILKETLTAQHKTAITARPHHKNINQKAHNIMRKSPESKNGTSRLATNKTIERKRQFKEAEDHSPPFDPTPARPGGRREGYRQNRPHLAQGRGVNGARLMRGSS